MRHGFGRVLAAENAAMGSAPPCSPTSTGEGAELRPVTRALLVYSVWQDGHCLAICDTLRRATWWRVRYPRALVEIHTRKGL